MNFKTPDPRMAGFITITLLFLFAFSYILPVINFSWIVKDPHFDAGLQQTLLMLLVLSVGYYIGTSKASEDKNAIIATQATAAAAAAAPPTDSSGTPIVKVVDSTPVKVTEVPPT